jgi:membrane fusion protein (multidrug efflux system)
MRIGDPVEIRVDAVPGVIFRGKLDHLAPASGSQFALLPPDNATGNFTKVVQRVPVRIALDNAQADLDKLRAGLSVVATVRTSTAGQ